MNFFRHSLLSRRQHSRRRGAAVVEFAITVPILLAFFIFLWEFARAEMIRHTIVTAAYEGARQGIVEGAQREEVEQTIDGIIRAVGIRDAQVDVSPRTILPTTDAVHVEITVPLSRNAVVVPFFMNGLNISTELTLDRS